MTTYRNDYQTPDWHIDQVDLCFDLDPEKTRVLNRMQLRRAHPSSACALRLDGEDIHLTRLLINGQAGSFRIEGAQLIVENLPDECELEILTTCQPSKNSQLMGLYLSHNTFFTQCEAQGFRRITYFLDRPDVMSRYQVTLRADQQQYPVLLSNGNLIEQGLLDKGRHYAVWQDPHKKPCYLFALVAGQLVAREQRISSLKDSSHLLQIYVRPGDLDKTEHAMQSLMASIAWDEKRFGLSLDLERFMIVATHDFNMGAMENKGLNIFNSKYVLANTATASDADFDAIESVVAHEYFHNWTGNRVSCRDWFQLSLKEGLTVFRDQEFSMDMTQSVSARAVKRIEDVRHLKSFQFAEDAGPMAHSVRPDQYEEINNFYTMTVYEKGAEVVRMMQTLVGVKGFAKGMSLYFERHDGQAVTCDDFVQAIAQANPESSLALHLPAFKRWYSQAGTPRVEWQFQHHEADQTLHLTLKQYPPLMANGQSASTEPFVIPVLVGLVGANGQSLPCITSQSQQDQEMLCVMTEAQHTFIFEQVPAGTIPSVLRDFSAPVFLKSPLSSDQYLHLLAHDSNAFNRWEAAQHLMVERVLDSLNKNETAAAFSEKEIEAFKTLLTDSQLSLGYKNTVLSLPSELYLSEQMQCFDPQRTHQIREQLRAQLAQVLFQEWQTIAQTLSQIEPSCSLKQAAEQRALHYHALGYLVLDAMRTQDKVWPHKALRIVKEGPTMTDRVGALQALIQARHPLAEIALDRFYQQFAHDDLVVDKWFALQASRPDHQGDVLPRIKTLLMHPAFHIQNPNRARSLLTPFCHTNPAAFHRADAAAYVLWADKVLEIDTFNPQVAARLARAMDKWFQLTSPYKEAAHEALKRIESKPSLSTDVREVISRALSVPFSS